MDRQELIDHVRSEVKRLKELGILKLRQERNLSELEKISESIDYSPFKDNPEPRFSVEELQVKGEAEWVALSFYRWGNPYVGQGMFYRKWNETVYYLANEAGRAGREIAEVENCKSLSKYYGNTTLEEFCGMVPMINE